MSTVSIVKKQKGWSDTLRIQVILEQIAGAIRIHRLLLTITLLHFWPHAVLVNSASNDIVSTKSGLAQQP